MHVAIPSFDFDTPVWFNIEISDGGGHHTVQRRYSDFVNLARSIESETGEKLPAPLPPKLWMPHSRERLEARRVELERVLQALVLDEVIRETMALAAFLEVSKLKSRSTPIAEWLSTTDQVRMLLSRAAMDAGSEKRRSLSEARALIQQLKRLVHSINDDQKLRTEQLRRMSVLENLEHQLAALEGTSNVDWRWKTTTNATPSASGYARVIGETEESRALSNRQLLNHQRDRVHQQDDEVKVLREAISRQRHLGETINAEITKQNQLLDDMESEVHRVGSRINQSRRATSKFL